LLEADVSTARFVRASGDATNTNPVMPDIAVSQSVEDWLRDEDTVLRRALEWISTGR
jgi:C-terminal processing protease CtpA/Prc